MRINGTEAISFSSPMMNNVELSTDKVNFDKPVAADVRSKAAAQFSSPDLNEFERNVLPISEQVVNDVLEKVNKLLAGSNRRFDISVHEKTNEIMVKVIDTETDEVIREIPPEKILDMIAKLWELAGLFVDERR